MLHFGAVNALTSIYDTQDKKQNSYYFSDIGKTRSSIILSAFVDRRMPLCEAFFCASALASLYEFKCIIRHHYTVSAGKDCIHEYGFGFTYHTGIVCCLKCQGGNLGQQFSSGKEEKNQQLPAG